MEAYSGFAQVYDEFMDNVPYEEWAKRIVEILKEYGIEDGLLLDLCCGTGKMTRLLADAGFDMIGIDSSEEMLEIAREQEYGYGDNEDFDDDEDDAESAENFKKPILYLCQDACDFELYGTVEAIVSVCDSLNYISEMEDLCTVFKLAANYLESRGLFIFDLNTQYKYTELLAQNTFGENREHCAFIWDNYYDEAMRINEYDLTLFTEDEDGRFERSTETHYERCYTLNEIKHLMKEAGLEFIAAYDGYTKEPVKETSERMVIVAREMKIEGKYYQ